MIWSAHWTRQSTLETICAGRSVRSRHCTGLSNGEVLPHQSSSRRGSGAKVKKMKVLHQWTLRKLFLLLRAPNFGISHSQQWTALKFQLPCCGNTYLHYLVNWLSFQHENMNQIVWCSCCKPGACSVNRRPVEVTLCCSSSGPLPTLNFMYSLMDIGCFYQSLDIVLGDTVTIAPHNVMLQILVTIYWRKGHFE